MCRSKSRSTNLDFALCALDTDSGAGCVVSVWVGSDAEICERDAVSVVRAVGGGGEGEDHGGFFVGAGGVFFDGGCYGGGFAVGGGDGVVEGLETPC